MNLFYKYPAFWLVFIALLFPLTSNAQQTPNAYALSIQDAVRLAKEKNNTVSAARMGLEASAASLAEVKSHVLPHLDVQASGKRLSNVTVYDHGFTESESLPPPPASYQANAGIEAAFNLYSGGKHEASIKQFEAKEHLADIHVKEREGSIALETVQHYLEILRLSKLDSLYKEQVGKEKIRLKNINSLYKNGKVTRSDVLRAEMNLSDREYQKKENESTIAINQKRLAILLNLPIETNIVLTDTVLSTAEPVIETENGRDAASAYSVQQASQNIVLQEAVIREARSNYYPSIELMAAYGYNYPNYLRYPYVPQYYAVGFVGFKMSYSLSSLYQNNHKVKAERMHLEEIKYNEQAAKDNVLLELASIGIKMDDMHDKAALAQKEIAQAEANYKIVTTKYFNQLALLADLLDADNLYLQTKYNLVEAQIMLQYYNYQSLYTKGKL
jgi:outer membrane protein TolC